MAKSFKYLFLFLLIPFTVKSQEAVKAVFLSINREASSIDELLVKMNVSLKKDKHKEMEQQTHAIETALTAIEKQANDLSLENSEKIYALTRAFRTDLTNFEKLVHKGGMFDNDKSMTAAFVSLKTRQNELREFLRNTYSALVAEPGKDKPLPSPTDTVQTHTDTSRHSVTAPPVQETPPPKTEPPAPTNGEGNASVLAEMHQAENQIAVWIDSLHIAAKKSLTVKIRSLARNVAGAAARLEDLTLLLKDGQKDNIKTLAGGLRQYAERLQALATKGHAAHEQVHQTIDLMETRLGVLSTGLRLVK